MKICLMVIDAFGIGAAPDAALYGDAGANTYRHVTEKTGLHMPNLAALGLNNIDGVQLEKVERPTAAYARLTELSPGKDTTTGHWEIAGVLPDKPFPTYPHGFPAALIAEFEKRIGTGVLFNGVASGTEIVKRYGAEHLKTGYPIVYTSADSVFQIAAHVDRIPLARLYEICRIARELLRGEHSVARVIARPFETQNGEFVRTVDRKDFSVEPYCDTVLDKVQRAGLTTYAVGKIADIFADRGITVANRAHGNSACLAATLAALAMDFDGLIFTNLVDTDMLYGHRRDAAGYALALAEIDAYVPKLIAAMGSEDILLLTGDHGCDPTFTGSDHTREYVPLLMYGKSVAPKNLGTINGFGYITDTICGKFAIEE